MLPQTTDVEIGDAKYQIGRMTARNGSWILTQVLTKMLPAMLETGLTKGGAKLPPNRSALSEEEFQSIQAHALAVCRRYEGAANAPMPIFLLPNTWAVKELEHDLVTILSLTVHSLVFNLTPFFAAGGLSQIMSLLPGLRLNSPNPQT